MNILEIDEEIGFLEGALDAIEPSLKDIINEIKERIKRGEDVDHLCDRSDFFSGLAFTICQKYISATIGWFSLGKIKVSKDVALKLGPSYNDLATYAQIINAAANYWKHSGEWNTISIAQEGDNDLFSVTSRDYSKLSNQAKRSIDILQKVTPWCDYMCLNILYELTKSDSYSLISLVPILTEWRLSLLKFYETM